MPIIQFLWLHSGQLLAMVLLLGAMAFFAAAETALFSLSMGQIHTMSRDSRPLRRLVASMMRRPRVVLTTVLLGSTFVNTLYFVTSTLLIFTMEAQVRHGAIWSSVTAAATLLAAVLLAEVLPKSLAYLAAAALAEAAAPVMSVLVRIVQPVHRFLMAAIVGPISRLVAPPRPRGADLSVEEMESLLNLSQRRGLIGQGESEMLQEVLELTDLKAADIMVPRVDMVAFEVSGSREELLDLIRRERVTKVPIYEKDIDHVLGVVYAKHLLARPEVPLAKQVAPVQFVPETAPLERVLMQFRAMRSQIGVVVDEYGGTAGLITLQDILEEIVGEIADAREPGTPPDVQPAGPGMWLVSGDLPIHEWAEAFPTELNAARFTTVGGFVISLLGGIPSVGQSARYHNIVFTVEAMRRRRISLLRVQLKERRR